MERCERVKVQERYTLNNSGLMLILHSRQSSAANCVTVETPSRILMWGETNFL